MEPRRNRRAVLQPHVVVKAGVSDGEWDREEALGRGRDPPPHPGSLAEQRSASPLPALGACLPRLGVFGERSRTLGALRFTRNGWIDLAGSIASWSLLRALLAQ